MGQEELETILQYLVRMGQPMGSLRACERVHGGVSGSQIYRLTLETEEFVLKLAAAHSVPRLEERARREVEFYRRLAGSVPVRVPRLLGFDAAAEAGICLLLTWHSPCPPPELWGEPDYLQVSEELGRLHAAFWDQEQQLSRFHWLRARLPGDSDADVRRAHGDWQALQQEEPLRSVLTPRRCRDIQALLRQIPAIDAMLRVVPPTLCHGDCHIANTVLVIEHHLDVIKTADWIIDLGPEGGKHGGENAVHGTPEAIAGCAHSYTGQFLRRVLR